MTDSVQIDYYSDVLCVWAWIAERRLLEVEREWGEQVNIRHHYMDIFGDSHAKIPRQWAERNGFSGFSEHVVEAAAPHPHAAVNPQLWKTVKPATSANAHLVLKAAQLALGETESHRLAQAFRHAFFVDAQDIGRLDVLQAVTAASAVDFAALQQHLADGTAIAALLSDHKLSQEQGLKGSPSWVMNNNRQTLYGNVGYRIISANIEEIMRNPEPEASWC
jgi:predicted DsbA family dithiol-disulfide isomerase